MKTTTLLVCALAFFSGVSALPTIAPAGIDCGNGLSCASGQTCLSNTTGAGELVTRSNSFAPKKSSQLIADGLLSFFQRRLLPRCALLLPSRFNLQE